MAMRRPQVNMTPREKVIQARISLLRLMPFFGTMAMHLTPIELTREEAQKAFGMENPTAGVDIYGNMPYSADFVAGLTQEELMFVLGHETMHVALEHLVRKGSRQPRLWNTATDEAINNLLKHEMRIWKQAYCSAQFEEKSAEEIYDDLLKAETIQKVYGSSGLPSPMDVHFYGSKEEATKKGGKPQSPFTKPGQETLNAPKMIKDAASFAKGQGKMPAGMARLFKDLLEPVMNWKDLLQKYIMAVLPQDWTYTKPSKRAQSAGFYMPSIVKETVDIIVGVDSSGSISDAEYQQFLSEIYAMTRAVSNLRATILICDAAISQVVEIDQTFDPAMDIAGRGYGGTSCIPVFQWIHEEKSENVKLLIYLTDGYIDEPHKLVYESGYPVLWVVTPRGATTFLRENIGNQMVIQMEKGIVGDFEDD